MPIAVGTSLLSEHLSGPYLVCILNTLSSHQYLSFQSNTAEFRLAFCLSYLYPRFATLKNTAPFILNIFTSLINSPMCNQFLIAADTSPFPQMFSLPSPGLPVSSYYTAPRHHLSPFIHALDTTCRPRCSLGTPLHPRLQYFTLVAHVILLGL